MRLESATQLFLNHLTIERGLSENTLKAYRTDLNDFVYYLLKDDKVEIESLSLDIISKYLEALSDKNMSKTTIARKLAAIKGFFRFLAKENMVGSDLTSSIASPKIPLRLPKALTIDEVTRLINTVKLNSPADYRDHAILEFMYATGCRISELVSADIDDLDLENQIVKLSGKGSKQRIVPLGDYALNSLNRYLISARPAVSGGALVDAAALFRNLRGGRLSRQGVWGVIRKYAKKAGIEAITPHSLRHSFATHLIDGGADIRVVQELLGHASVATTQIYTKVTIEGLRGVYAVSHPRAL